MFYKQCFEHDECWNIYIYKTICTFFILYTSYYFVIIYIFDTLINKHKLRNLQYTISDRIRCRRKLNIKQVKFCLLTNNKDIIDESKFIHVNNLYMHTTVLYVENILQYDVHIYLLKNIIFFLQSILQTDSTLCLQL